MSAPIESRSHSNRRVVTRSVTRGFRYGLVMIGLLPASETFVRGDEASAGMTAWEIVHVNEPPARMDAIVELAPGVVLVGTRSPAKGGHVLRSRDGGLTWTDLGGVVRGKILNLRRVDDSTALASTLEGDVWKSSDQGASWSKLAHVSDHRIYSLAVLPDNVVLACDVDRAKAGHIYRSTDGGRQWTDLGRIDPVGLYRFEVVHGGVLVNAFSGRLYKSIDAGTSWREVGAISASPLYPIDSRGRAVLLGDEAGVIYRSEDAGDSWTQVANFGQPLDDFVWVDDNIVHLSAYSGNKYLYSSEDGGRSWAEQGPLPDDDVLDHVIALTGPFRGVAVGGSTSGKIYRWPARSS